MNLVTKIFKYIEPLWVGVDGKISVRQCLAIYFSYKLIENVDYVIQKWDQGRPLGDISTIILTLAGTVPLLLGITAWSNMTAKKIDSDASSPSDTTITVQKAENVTTTGKTTAEVVNAEKVETVNTQTTNIKEPEDAK